MNDETTWETLKHSLKAGSRVGGIVTRHAPFGIFVEIKGVPFAGLIQITDFKDGGRMSAEEYPPVGAMIEGVVLGFKESGQQIWLGMKPSQLRQESGHADSAE